MAKRKVGFFKQIITGVDCETYDLVRVLILIGCLFFLGVNGYILWLKGTFDLINFALGYTSIMAGGSAGIFFKQNTEPGMTTTVAAMNPKPPGSQKTDM